MKRRTFLGITATGIAVVGAGVGWSCRKKNPIAVGVPTDAPQGEGWINLLDEAHARGWKNTVDDKEIFEIRDGLLHIFGRTVYPLRYAGYTAERFSDFDLHIEFRVKPNANSGVFLRSQVGDPVYRGFEIQVLEDYGKAPNKNGCGAIYDVAAPMFNMSRPAGQWNSFDIHLQGRELIVRMNGWMVIHADFALMTKPIGKFQAPFAELPLEGHLLLQDHGGEVWYRNIYIKRI